MAKWVRVWYVCKYNHRTDTQGHTQGHFQLYDERMHNVKLDLASTLYTKAGCRYHESGSVMISNNKTVLFIVG